MKNEQRQITNDTVENSKILFELIEQENISGTEVFNMFTNWHGTRLCTRDFMENLRDCECYDLPEDEEDEDEEEEE